MINFLRGLKYLIREYAQLLVDHIYCMIPFSSIYVFSAEDKRLYFKERKRDAVEMLVGDASDGMQMITILDARIYWPNAVSCADLPWVWNEVFVKFSDNPSSYDHPLMGYGNKDWVIDAGASEGYFALFVLPRLKKSAKLIVVEPLSSMRNSLQRTISAASGSEVIVVQSALGATNSKTFLQVNSKHICCSKILSDNLREDDALEEIEVVTLDSLTDRIDLRGSGVIKMDIEGYEMKALEGAKELLRYNKPALAIAVYHGYENALECAKIIRMANSEYKIEFRGWYGYKKPPRPYILFAY